jgi:photosystem II stability/assembly factor-like uncharacterized protein
LSDGPYIYAGTSAGLWRSVDNGQSWSPLHTLQLTDVRFLASHGSTLEAASVNGVVLSSNGGASWTMVMPPSNLTQIGAIAVDGENNLWIGGPEGVFYSKDRGASWRTIHDLFVRQVDGLYYDAAGKRVLVTTSNSTVAFAADLSDDKITYWDTGWKLRFLRPVGDHLIGATLFDGMVVQPRMVVSAFAPAADTATEASAKTH